MRLRSQSLTPRTEAAMDHAANQYQATDKRKHDHREKAGEEPLFHAGHSCPPVDPDVLIVVVAELLDCGVCSPPISV